MMLRKQNRITSILISCCLLCSGAVIAKENLSLSDKTATAEALSRQTEQDQLAKARQAASETEQRQQEVLQRQEAGEWQAEQRAKAQAEFNQRETREQKYLREAAEAAAKTRKIPQP